MTSLSSGLPRPVSSSIPLGSTKLDTRPAHAVSPKVEADTPTSTDFGDRPSKRRKVEGESPNLSSPKQTKNTEAAEDKEDEANTSRYARVSWLTALTQHSGKKQEVDSRSEPPPLPTRPWGPDGLSDVKSNQSRDPCRRRADVPVPTSPDSMKTPTERVTQNGNRPPGYFPWVGKHPEDVLNDTNVKQGYYDRPPNPSEKELNTAKAPLYNALKHRSGLESLSALFSLVLDQKSRNGALSTTSSFKPPARVTLTEAKRKSWITELANPQVPLRRLSRTIPQGIRGQVLLDQCLLHWIPLNRAIWFIKCVGANDIRTLKRKGIASNVAVGAENKWLKDWTTSVEQFLENVLTQCGQPKWQQTIQYALRLSTRLYLDNMLDRDHYLDWMVRSLDAADTNLTPFWLIIVNLHKMDLARFRKRGKQFASALISRFVQAESSGAPLQPLLDRLRATLRWLVTAKPSCFLMPDQWQQCEQALSSCLNLADENERHLLNRIRSNNKHAMGIKPGSIADETRPEEKIVAILDSACAPFNLDQISASLQSVTSDRVVLFNCCVEWCISRYRASPARVYFTARLIRRWQRSGLDVDKVMFDFLTAAKDASVLNLDAFRHLFADLSRSKSISTSRYMQWVMVQGFVSRTGNSVDRNPTPSIQSTENGQPWIHVYELLSHVCLVNAEDHIINLRQNLLEKVDFDLDTEAAALSTAKTEISRVLSHIDRSKAAIPECKLSFETIKNMRWSARLDLSHWLRTQVVEYAKNASIEIPGKPPLPGARSFTTAHYSFVRHVTECIDDIPVLADMLRLLSTAKQEAVLASLVDTLNHHSQALSAIGAMETLQNLYSQAYVSLRAIRPSILLFTTSMLDLCTRFPCKRTPVKALQQDFVRGDRGRAIAAYSPFSDSMAETLGQAGATFLDDFEAVLQAETNMNEYIMLSLFTVLVDRISKAEKGEADVDDVYVLYQLLSRLKLFRRAQGELLIRKWLARCLTDNSPLLGSRIALTLVATRCITIKTLLEIANELSPSSQTRSEIYRQVRSSLYGKERDSDEPYSELHYAVMLATKHLKVDLPQKALEVVLLEPESWKDHAESCTEILGRCFLDGDKYHDLTIVAKEKLPSMIDGLCSSADNPTIQIKDLVEHVNLMSLPFHKYRLEESCKKSILENEGEAANEIAEALLRSVKHQIEVGNPNIGIFRSLLQAAGPQVSLRLREMTNQAFVEALPRFLQTRIPGTPAAPTSEEKQLTAMAIEQAIALGSSQASSETSSGLGLVLEKLTLLMRYLGGRQEPPPSTASATTPASTASVPPTPTTATANTTPLAMEERVRDFSMGCMDYFSMLLQVVCLGRRTYKAASSAGSANNLKQLQQEQIKLVAVIVGIIVQPLVAQLLNSVHDFDQRSKIQETLVYAFDVAATLVDDMSEESRMMCARILKEKLKDGRVQWLLGSVNMFGSLQSQDAAQGLQVVHETKGVMGDFRPKIWEVLESGAGNESDTCLGLGMFGATRS